jgi:hypothetical protein
VSINNAITELATSKVRELPFGWNHLVSNVNATNLYYSGLVLRGQNTSQQPVPITGQPANGTIIVSGTGSQGLDISGTSGLTLRDLTSSGDALAGVSIGQRRFPERRLEGEEPAN